MYVVGVFAALLGLASGALAILLARSTPVDGVLPIVLGDLVLLRFDARWGEQLLAGAAGGAALFLALATGLLVAGFHRSRQHLHRRLAGDTASLEARSRLLRERLVFLEERVGTLERTRAELEARKEELEREVAQLDDALERRRQALKLGERGNVVVVPEPTRPVEPDP